MLLHNLLKMVVHIAREEKRRPNRKELGLLEDEFDPVRIIMGHVAFVPGYYEVKMLNI